MADEKILCETPTPGKQRTRIDTWKYEAVKRAIFKAIPKGSKGVLFKDLSVMVEKNLKAKEKANLGSIGWYTTCVKLDLEVKGVLRRVPGTSPQWLIRE